MVSFWDYDFARIIPRLHPDQLHGQRCRSAVTWRTYLNTLKYAAMVWAITVVIGFTVAYFLAFHVRTAGMQIVLFLVCTVPFLDVEHHPHDLVDPVPRPERPPQLDAHPARRRARAARVAALSPISPSCWRWPTSTCCSWSTPIFNTLMRIDRSLIEAARDAGASGWQVLRTSSSRSPSRASPSARSSSSRW